LCPAEVTVNAFSVGGGFHPLRSPTGHDRPFSSAFAHAWPSAHPVEAVGAAPAADGDTDGHLHTADRSGRTAAVMELAALAAGTTPAPPRRADRPQRPALAAAPGEPVELPELRPPCRRPLLAAR
jgi:hypothetical protein